LDSIGYGDSNPYKYAIRYALADNDPDFIKHGYTHANTE
jgi:hypothetical protein